MEQTTDEFLAIHFPGVPKSWLRRVSEKLGIFKSINGGDVEMHVRFKNGQDQWTDWTMRDLSPKQYRT